MQDASVGGMSRCVSARGETKKTDANWFLVRWQKRYFPSVEGLNLRLMPLIRTVRTL
jgi:hypothetical protein